MLVSAAALLEAGSIHGVVTDPDGAAVPNAHLTLYARDSAEKRSTRTGPRGAYEFTAVGGGEYLLEVKATGFAQATTHELRLAGGAAVSRDLRLELARLRTEVSVTASSTPLMLEEVAKTIDVVGSEEIHLRNEYSVAEAIRLVPGVRVQQAGGPGSLTTVQTRGLETHHTAFLVDGLRMRDPADPQGAVTPFWENLMAVSTERAEVLRGSGSSLYGSHAIGGTINVVSHEGGGSPRGEVSAEGGGLGMARGLARFSGGTLHNRLLSAAGVPHANVTGGLD
ncbi:MAG: TonB-dependent receptor plug domain-containing protein, partial [bacterium]|nr:TonB-dependent receptor plug domain-containing protein [bacterium]